MIRAEVAAHLPAKWLPMLRAADAELEAVDPGYVMVAADIRHGHLQLQVEPSADTGQNTRALGAEELAAAQLELAALDERLLAIATRYAAEPEPD